MSYALSPNVRDAVRDSDHRIVITGAGGWLGLATLELLSDALGDDLDSRVVCFGASRRTLTLLDGREVDQHPLADIASLASRPSLVLHLAFLTKDRAEAMPEADYRRANRALSAQLLDALDAIDSRAVFVASSGAARFADDPTRSPAMRLYGELKRADEEAFAAWAADAGRRAVVTRLFNIAGPHINKVRSYALSAFILDALETGTIRVNAPHRVMRGYVAIRELMSLVFALLLDAPTGVVRFDSGGEAMELAEVAAQVARELGATVERAPLTSPHDDIYLGDNQRYIEILEQHFITGTSFSDQIAGTVDFLRGRTASSGNHASIGASRS